jgi:hypothetical protein
MTAPDHRRRPSRNLLHRRGHRTTPAKPASNQAMIVPAVTRLLAAGGAFERERLSHAANPCADACPTSKRRRPALRDTPGEAGVVVRNWRWNSTSGAGKSKDWEDRNRCRSHCVRDGHRFESPQLHQEVGANGPGFPTPTIRRQFSALARKLMVCGVYSAGTTGLGPRARK